MSDRPKPRAVVFDLDGTLVDSRLDIAAAVNHALVTTKRSAMPIDEIVALVGDGARTLLARATGVDESAAEIDVLLDAYMAHYLAHPADLSTWMDGALEALDRLSALGLPIALCTNKARVITDALLASIRPTFGFRAIYGGGDGTEKKPSAGPLVALAATLAVAPSELVMIGDGPQDVLAARAADAWSIAIASGFQPRASLVEARPDVVVSGLGDVTAVIEGWISAR
jgi:2-phosphoglycolate phosphatase